MSWAFITKPCSFFYYKTRRFFYYKTRQVLQNEPIIKKHGPRSDFTDSE